MCVCVRAGARAAVPMEGADADNDVVVPVEADINTVRARQTAAASRKLLWSGVLVLPVVWCINIALHRRATTAAKCIASPAKLPSDAPLIRHVRRHAISSCPSSVRSYLDCLAGHLLREPVVFLGTITHHRHVIISATSINSIL